jgi:GntR family transcriptional regulator
MTVIERSSPVPYYEQLYAVLLERIQRGEIEQGDRLPGESELHREFNLSRATVRQALELLESNGYAQRIARRGYFVAAPEAPEGWLIEGPGGFLENGIGHASPRVSTTVISAAEKRLHDEVTAALRIPRGSIGYVLERVRRADGHIALFSTNFTPPTVAPIVAGAVGVRKGSSSLTSALQAAGYVAAGARRVIHAVAAPKVIATHLQISTGTPLLRIRAITWDKSLVPYDYYETWLRTDVVPLEVDATTRRVGADDGIATAG